MTRTRPLILVVDDSHAIRRFVCDTLFDAGFDVVEAEDGEDGVRRASRAHFSLVLTDQNMPRLDGLGLVRSLRARSEYAQVPILMLTTECSAEMTQQGRRAGASGWIVKPFEPASLVHVVRKVLSSVCADTHGSA